MPSTDRPQTMTERKFDFLGEDVTEHRVWNDTMCKACETGNLEVVSQMIQNGFNVNYSIGSDESEEGPLLVAARNGQVEVVKFLLDNGARIDREYYYFDDEQYLTSLDAAAYGRHVEVVKLLLERNASSDNVLDFALRERSLEIVKLLIEHGVDTDDAFVNAVETWCVDKVKLLTEAGAIVPLAVQRIVKNVRQERVDNILSKSVENLKF